MRPINSKLLLSGLAAALLAQGCVMAEDDLTGGAQSLDNEPPLADVDELLAGAPKADEIERRYKGDENLPAGFDLVEFQSPVKSQGSRGTCSIFSTVGLMEHLYILEGSMPNPDFSEQYLQWSAKFQVGAFPSSSGSTASSNIRAINEFGIPEDSVWPYEAAQWDAEDDPACEGDRMPTRCYTNGEPPASAQGAQKFHLPRSEWLHFGDIKSHMKNTNQGVIGGMTVYYQAWGHGRSNLPTNDQNWAQGIVTYPNQADIDDSNANRAGHSILLVGWDDEMEVQRLDENGEPMVDADGNPVMDKGFYIFKNSWGTGSFGVNNDIGAGYGYIAQEYVHEFARLRTSDVPGDVVVPDQEICDDGLDNDGNGAFDCDDAQCSEAPVCSDDSSELVFEGEGADIPDNDEVGASSTIAVEEEATVGSVTVDVNITHTFRGDLTVTLHHGGQAVTLHQRTGGGSDNLDQTYEVDEFAGADLAGDWKLVVTDTAARDTGRIDDWTLSVLSN